MCQMVDLKSANFRYDTFFWNPQDQGNVLGSIYRHLVYHQDDQEDEGCHLSMVLVEIGCLDGVHVPSTYCLHLLFC